MGWPWSRMRHATTAARLPPALSPPTPTCSRSTPIRDAWSRTQRVAATASSTEHGNGCSGANRYSTEMTTHFARYELVRGGYAAAIRAAQAAGKARPDIDADVKAVEVIAFLNGLETS